MSLNKIDTTNHSKLSIRNRCLAAASISSVLSYFTKNMHHFSRQCAKDYPNFFRPSFRKARGSNKTAVYGNEICICTLSTKREGDGITSSAITDKCLIAAWRLHIVLLFSTRIMTLICERILDKANGRSAFSDSLSFEQICLS